MEGSGAGVLSEGYTDDAVCRSGGGHRTVELPDDHMVSGKIGSAIAAGNTIVVKPAPTTPSSTLLIAELRCRLVSRPVC